MEPRCDNCRFWASSGGSQTCRRHAPQITTAGYWPETFPDDWCGDFAMRLKEPGERVTIQTMALALLEDGPKTTQEIVALIPAKYGVEVMRESLSPQLSRLRERGELVLHGRTWSRAG